MFFVLQIVNLKMNWLRKNENWILGIAIIFAVIVALGIYIWEEKFLTADFERIDGVIETEYFFMYLKLK